MNTYIGIDLGGTNVRVAKVDQEGHILHEVKGPSYGTDGPNKVMPNIKRLIREIPDYASCEGIGIGVPGPVDTLNGCMLMSTNLPGFTNYPLAKELSDEFNMPAYMDNDANVAGLAEAMVGSGKGKNIVYYVTISTGIGGALIVNGKVVSGKNGHAGEVGNIVIDRNRKKYNHLNVGAIENEASGTAVARIGKERLGERVHSAVDVFNLAKEGNDIAKDIIDNVAYDLAMMFSAIAHVADPDIFIVGGGMMKSKDQFFDKMKEYFYSLVHIGMRSIEFSPVALAEPGIIGAAMLPISHTL